MRGCVALIPVLLFALAGCGESAEGPAAAATTAPAASAAPGVTVSGHPVVESATASAPVRVKAKQSGSGNPSFGTQYAFLTSSKLSTRQITYDLVEWYDGKQAVKACAEDGEKAAENDYCTGYYIRNNNKKLRTLTVYPDAPIRMMVDGEMKIVDLKTFLAGVPGGSVIHFDVDANRIVKLDQVYLP